MLQESVRRTRDIQGKSRRRSFVIIYIEILKTVFVFFPSVKFFFLNSTNILDNLFFSFVQIQLESLWSVRGLKRTQRMQRGNTPFDYTSISFGAVIFPRRETGYTTYGGFIFGTWNGERVY